MIIKKTNIFENKKNPERIHFFLFTLLSVRYIIVLFQSQQGQIPSNAE